MPPNTYPHLCREVGLSCEDCVEAVAGQTARLCPGLRSRAVGQLFVQIYPNPACAPMHANFKDVYHRMQRKGPGREARVASASA